MANPFGSRLARARNVKIILSFIISNILGRASGILIDIFLLVSASGDFLVEYFTAQACILFPFAVCSSLSVHTKNTSLNGVPVAVLAVAIQGAIIFLFAKLNLGLAVLLGAELLVLVWAIKHSSVSNLVQVFPWSGAAFNIVLLLLVCFVKSDQLQPLILLIFGMRLVVFVVLLLIFTRSVKPRKIPAGEVFEIGQWKILVRFLPVVIRQFVFINARFVVPENLLSIVSVGGRILQNTFVFLIYPVLLSDVKIPLWLSFVAAFFFAAATATAVYLATGDPEKGAMIFGLTLLVVGMEFGFAVRSKMRCKVDGAS